MFRDRRPFREGIRAAVRREQRRRDRAERDREEPSPFFSTQEEDTEDAWGLLPGDTASRIIDPRFFW